MTRLGSFILGLLVAVLIWQVTANNAPTPTAHLLTARVVSQDHYAEWKAEYGFALLPCERTAHIPDDTSGSVAVAFINCLQPVNLR